MTTKFLIAAFGFLVACTTAAVPDKGTTTVTQADPAWGCALGVEGTMVTTNDTDDGIILTFTNPRAVKELRERVFDASVMFGPAKLGKGHDGKHGEGGHHGLKPMQMPPAYASSTDIEGGARIQFTPVYKTDAEALRIKLRERALEMTRPCNR